MRIVKSKKMQKMLPLLWNVVFLYLVDFADEENQSKGDDDREPMLMGAQLPNAAIPTVRGQKPTTAYFI